MSNPPFTFSLPLLAEPEPPPSPLEALLAAARQRIAAPVAIVLGSPRQAAAVVGALQLPETTCYQMDLFQAGRLAQEVGAQARVLALPDVWDLPGSFRTAIFIPQQGGERALKIDMVEQASHILPLGGNFIVLSSYESDQLFGDQLKKVLGKAHQQSGPDGTIIWAKKEKERPRRRHEVTIQARLGDESLRFITRPGVFSYSELDAGARALIETMEIQAGDRVLDLGCGIGSNGIVAGRKGAGEVVFVDSNVRAVALAELNATACQLSSFRTIGSATLTELPEKHFDVILANPPYYAQQAIAHFFIAKAQLLLKKGGRFYLVTRQPGGVQDMIQDTFGPPHIVERRGYTIFRCNN